MDVREVVDLPIAQIPSQLLQSLRERTDKCNQHIKTRVVLTRSKLNWKAKLSELALDMETGRRKLKLR